MRSITQSSLLFLIVCCLCSNAQGQKTVHFTFKRPEVGSSIYQYIQKIECTLEYPDSTDTSVFKYIGLLDYMFKRSGSSWYVKQQEDWMPFFNNGKQVDTKFVFSGETHSIKWEMSKQIDGDAIIYKFRFVAVDPNYFSPYRYEVYYFTYKDGIIAIDGHDAFLTRTDKKNIKYD